MRRLHTITGLLLLTAASCLSGTTGAQSLPTALVQPSHLTYLGAFRLPDPSGPGGATGDNNSFHGNAGPLVFLPATHSLLAAGSGCCQPTTIAEIQIPEIRQATSIAGLARATYRQPHTAVLGSKQAEIGCGGPIGGLLPRGTQLLVSAFCYYDAGYLQTRSHFVTALAFAPSSTVGPFEVQSPARDSGRAGFVSGYMTTIPAEWQAALGGPALTGNCCLSIISRTSWGPAVSVFNPSDIGVRDPVPAIAVLGYPMGHPLDGDNGCDDTSTLFNCTTKITGVLFPAGTSSVLFFGSHGTGDHCYGRGTTNPSQHRAPDPDTPGEMLCYDPAGGSKGPHTYPYRHQIWAYNAADLVRVKNGQVQPWQVRPYAVWGFDTPFAHPGRLVQGVAYDEATRRIFVSIGEQDAPRPLIHVFRLEQIGGAPPPPDPVAPTVQITQPSTGPLLWTEHVVQVAASDDVAVTGVRIEVNGSLLVDDEDAPYTAAWLPDRAGSHVIRAVARDAAGNTATSERTIVVIDGLPPPEPPPAQTIATQRGTISGFSRSTTPSCTSGLFTTRVTCTQVPINEWRIAVHLSDGVTITVLVPWNPEPTLRIGDHYDVTITR